MCSRIVKKTEDQMTGDVIASGQLWMVIAVLDMRRLTHSITDTDTFRHRLVCHRHYSIKLLRNVVNNVKKCTNTLRSHTYYIHRNRSVQ